MNRSKKNQPFFEHFICTIQIEHDQNHKKKLTNRKHFLEPKYVKRNGFLKAMCPITMNRIQDRPVP